jgi:hypothetical protein
MNPEQEFDRRIAAIHGHSNPYTATPHTGGDPIDVRHAEFQAMADVFLGEDFDRAKLAQVESLQIALHERQAELYQRYESKELSPVGYVNAFNALLDDTFAQCENILGQNDFLKFFGAPRTEMSSFIDREAFLDAHHRGE